MAVRPNVCDPNALGPGGIKQHHSADDESHAADVKGLDRLAEQPDREQRGKGRDQVDEEPGAIGAHQVHSLVPAEIGDDGREESYVEDAQNDVPTGRKRAGDRKLRQVDGKEAGRSQEKSGG